MKRIFLFLITNLAILVTLSIVISVLGLDRYITAQGFNFGALLGFAAVFGFGGAFISLAISKWTAKMAVGAQVITTPRNPAESWLLETVRRQAKAAGIGMPEVAIYPAEEVNAFATGMNRNNALVAVSAGLLHHMTRDEAEAVLGHEVSHVSNGDMVTLALIQGVLNTFVIFIARAVGHVVDRAVFKNENGVGAGFFITYIAMEILLGILATGVVMWFSRQREFRADAGSARLAGRAKMIAALQRLKGIQEETQLPERLVAFGIKGRARRGLAHWFASHPPLDSRIAALQSGNLAV